MRYGSLIDYDIVYGIFTNPAFGFTNKKGDLIKYGLLESPNVSKFHGEVNHKIYLCGKSGSGKTMLLSKLANRHSQYINETFGIQVTEVYWPVFLKETKKMILFRLSFWDCSEISLNSFAHLLTSCLENTDCLFYVFSQSNKAMYEDIPKLIARVNVNDDVMKVFVATNHLQTNSEVTYEMTKDLEQVWNFPVISFESKANKGTSSLKANEYLLECSTFLNKICELLWYHDQVKAGLFPKTSIDYCFVDTTEKSRTSSSVSTASSKVTFC